MTTDRERHDLEQFVLRLAETCVRNTALEVLHAGRFPRSASGAYSDVRVVTPDGDIPWTEVSRLSDPEMEALMIEVTTRLYTCFAHPEASTDRSPPRATGTIPTHPNPMSAIVRSQVAVPEKSCFDRRRRQT